MWVSHIDGRVPSSRATFCCFPRHVNGQLDETAWAFIGASIASWQHNLPLALVMFFFTVNYKLPMLRVCVCLCLRLPPKSFLKVNSTTCHLEENWHNWNIFFKEAHHSWCSWSYFLHSVRKAFLWWELPRALQRW